MTFEADWSRKEFASGKEAKLIWCKGNGRERITQFIDDAKHSLWVQNERYQDQMIIEHLVRAKTRGVARAQSPHRSSTATCHQKSRVFPDMRLLESVCADPSSLS